MYNITELETTAKKARNKYHSSNGSNWLGIVVVLKTLSDAYAAENRIEEASGCVKEADEIIEQQKQKLKFSLFVSETRPINESYFKSISYWMNMAEVCTASKEWEDYPSKYAKTVNSLCDFLCAAGQYDVALLQYEEALQALYPKTKMDSDDPDLVYMTLVLLLKTAICAKELGDGKLSQKYTIMSFNYLAENTEKKTVDTSVDWQYVSELCRKMM